MESTPETTVMVAPEPEVPLVLTSRRAVSLSLLHGFELFVDDAAVQVPLASQRVVAFLVLHRRRLARLFVAGNLWTDANEEHAAAALRTALWRLGPAAGALVCCDGPTLAIDPRVEIDLDRATSTARELLDSTDTAVSAMSLATLLDEGELLPDWYDDWVIFERERFRQLRLHALEALCHRLSAEGRHALATEAGLAAVVSEPLRESAHRALISAHLREGNAGEALHQYQLCRELLRRELDLAPSAQLERLVAHVRHRDGTVTLAR